ncbi:MAG: Rpn family recombination-promoting nuclease/putative transposase [Lachnospiraceae bacterium]|nr:Rpn family recombination-promoting nuclease/putative transposase [Lachnospiraceae bacterium]
MDKKHNDYDFLMKPKIDFAFKEIMTDEKARIGFLSAVMKLKPEDIKETYILNPYLDKVHAEDKLGILDVRILMNNDTEIDTEIQLSEIRIWANRALFYAAKMYTDQIEQGQKYDVLKKCVSISILDFELFKEQKEFYSSFHIKEDTRNFLYTDKMEFHVIELPKLPKELKENSSDVELWAKFINAEREEEFDMLAKQNPYIESAYKKLQIISQDKEKRLEYEAREKAIRDYNQSIHEAEQRGIEIGEQRGIEIGEQRGIEMGIKNMAKTYQKFGQSYKAAKEAIQEEYSDVDENLINTIILEVYNLQR